MNKIRIECTDKQLDLIVDKLANNLSEENLSKYFGVEKGYELYDRFERTEPKRWRAENGGKYYSIRVDGKITDFKDEYAYTDCNLYEIGNYFETAKEAEVYANKFRELLQSNT